MTAPLVSVVMPVYNGERYLHRSVRSVLDQTYDRVELVAVDDGSADGSAQVLKAYEERLTLVRQPNRGVAEARNTGIRASRGAFIAFLDQDDWWLPEKVERQIECFQNDERIGLVHTAAVHYDEAADSYCGGSASGAVALAGFCYESLLLDNLIYNSSVMVRREVFDAVGLVDTGVAGNTVQDYELWLRIARRFPLGFVPEPLTVWRLHPGQGYWKRRKMLGEELRLLEQHVGDPPPERLRERFAVLLEQLGRAHLEAREPGPARRCFARSLRLRPSRRNAMFYGLSFLPPALVQWLWQARAGLRQRAGVVKKGPIPSWAGRVETSSPARPGSQAVCT